MKSVYLQKGFKAYFHEDERSFSRSCLSLGAESTAQGGQESRGVGGDAAGRQGFLQVLPQSAVSSHSEPRAGKGGHFLLAHTTASPPISLVFAHNHMFLWQSGVLCSVIYYHKIDRKHTSPTDVQEISWFRVRLFTKKERENKVHVTIPSYDLSVQWNAKYAYREPAL